MLATTEIVRKNAGHDGNGTDAWIKTERKTLQTQRHRERLTAQRTLNE